MNMPKDFHHPHAWVTGATSQIGHFLVPRLQAAGFVVTALSRQPQINAQNMIWQQRDLRTDGLPKPQNDSDFNILFHLAPLPLLPLLLTRLPLEVTVSRIVALSSTSGLTKVQSADSAERQLAQQLQAAETAVIEIAQQQGISWTLFRPTLIYGCGQDKNVTFIAQFIRRFGFFPIVAPGCGLRQPVHAEDIAAACLQACLSPCTVQRIYELSGGETLTYRQMVEAIFRQLDRKPRFISLPQPLFQRLIQILKWFLPLSQLSTAMITRMNQDLCFDHQAAAQDFGYQPRRFSDHHLGF